MSDMETRFGEVEDLYFGQKRNDAIPLLQTLADEGYAPAQYLLGMSYWCGDVTDDGGKAIEWWLKAAEQGHDEAQYWLGNSYYFGQGGVEEDKAKAREWYAKAAGQGHEKARESLAKLDGRPNTRTWPSNPGGLPDYVLERGAWQEFDEDGNRRN